MQVVKADTQVKIVLGPVLAIADGITPVTTLNLGTADEAELMKHDASSVTDISGATFAAITGMDGYYNLTLTTSHTDTEGLATIGINDDSLCLPVKKELMVANSTFYDAAYGTGGLLTEVEVGLLLDTTIDTVNSQTEFVLASSPTPSDQDDEYNDLIVVITDAGNTERKSTRQVNDYVGSTGTLTISSAASFTAAASDSIKIYARYPSDNTISSNVSSIKTVTDALGSSAATIMATLYGEAETGTVTTGNFTATDTIFQTASLTDTSDNAYKDKELMFTSGTRDKERATVSASEWVSAQSETKITLDRALSGTIPNGGAFIII